MNNDFIRDIKNCASALQTSFSGITCPYPLISVFKQLDEMFSELHHGKYSKLDIEYILILFAEEIVPNIYSVYIDRRDYGSFNFFYHKMTELYNNFKKGLYDE